MEKDELLLELLNLLKKNGSLNKKIIDVLEQNIESEYFEKHWNVIEETFDWVNVQKAMSVVGWTWGNEKPPTIEEMKKTAHDLCLKAWRNTEYRCQGTGGFLATYVEADDDEPEMLRLEFIFEEAESE
jgi:hypothetical protein